MRLLNNLYIIGLTVLTCSCVGETFDGDFSKDASNGNTLNSGELGSKIMVASSNLNFSLVDGRSSRADINEMWSHEPFYVYAFVTNCKDFRTTRRQDIDQCLVDASFEKDYLQSDSLTIPGRKTWLNSYFGNSMSFDSEVADAETGFTPQVLYYNHNYPTTRYNFFSYHLGNVKDAVLNREEKQISIDMTVDGTQDLLLSKAELTKEQKEALNNFDENNAYVVRTTCYNEYCAQREIHPIFQYKHALTNLSCNIYPAGKNCDGITIDSVAVISHPHVRMIVACNDESSIGATYTDNVKESFNFKKEGAISTAHLKWDDKYATDSLYHEVYNRPAINIGDSLFVSPDNNYDVVLFMTQEQGSKIVHYTTTASINRMPINGQMYGFRGGYKYDIRVAVYGLQETKIDVYLQPWDFGGDINVKLEDIYHTNE